MSVIDEQVDDISKKYNIYNNMLYKNKLSKRIQSPTFPNIPTDSININSDQNSDEKRNTLKELSNIPKTWDLIKRNRELSEKVKTMKNTYVPQWKIISLERENNKNKNSLEESKNKIDE